MIKKKLRKSSSPFSAVMKKAVQRFAILLLSLFCIAVFYLAVILGEPSADVQPVQAATVYIPENAIPSGLPRSMGGMHMSINSYAAYFPAPILFMQESESVVFQAGNLYEIAYNKGIARYIDLIYQVADTGEVLLRSIYPAGAYDLLGKSGYSIETLPGTLGKISAVRMVGESRMRFHAQANDALYAMTAYTTDNRTMSELGLLTSFTLPPSSEE